MLLHRSALALLLLLPSTPMRSEAAQSEAPSTDLSRVGTWPPEFREAQAAREGRLLAGLSGEEFSKWHDLVAAYPHPAGSEGDSRLIEALLKAFGDMGYTVERHDFWTLLCRPVRAELSLVLPEKIDLPVTERALAEDPDTAHPDLDPGWNAYSGSGTVEGEVVYVNYGTLADFQRLEELGVDCSGKIVLARYGGNFRGYKAKFAEAAGAAGLVIFTDPEDSGYGRGLPYPEGGYANETSIQRGSIKALAYDGDPLTPLREATEDAERLDERDVALPTIPVQPVGWGAASEILSRMDGPEVPGDWQGGLPFRYRLSASKELRVRLTVVQAREVVRTSNVLATLAGKERPDEGVIIGSHHDAWGHGAADSGCGLISLLEAARVLAAERDAGWQPRRSITFACWGAEEFGIIGSVEWVEGNLEALRAKGVAYLNVDMAAMGPHFRSACAPELQSVIRAATERVPSPLGEGAIADHWTPRFGDLGGGSDHVGFVSLAGVPSASLGGGGSRGVSYHSTYDTRRWYRQVVGTDYGAASMVAGMTLITSLRLAEAPVLPLDLVAVGRETRRHLADLTRRGREAGLLSEGEGAVAPELARIEGEARAYEARAARLEDRLATLAFTLPLEQRNEIDQHLRWLSRAWIDPVGLPGRPFCQSLYAASDETSGYAAWMLPLLRKAIEDADADLFIEAERRTRAVFDRLQEQLDAIDLALDEE